MVVNLCLTFNNVRNKRRMLPDDLNFEFWKIDEAVTQVNTFGVIAMEIWRL